MHDLNEIKILITGANGFIGQHLISNLLTNSDVEVVAAVRANNSSLKFSAENTAVNVMQVGDLSNKTDWSQALLGTDVVIHLAGRAHMVNEEPSNSLDLHRRVNCCASVDLLRQAGDAGVKRFIFLSSIGVIGNVSRDAPFTETTLCNPTSAYAKSKLEAEIALTNVADELSIELVIIRPPLVYGNNAPGNFGKLIQLVKSIPVLPFGLVNNKKSFISINNLVNFIDTCISHPKAANETFVIADNDVISTKDLIDYLAVSLGKNIFQIPVPLVTFRYLLKCVGKENLAAQLLDDLELDTSKAKSVLSWQPKESTKSSLENLFYSKSC